MSPGHGFGKVILFGEHFVVHGLPALVAALDAATTATITKVGGDKLVLIDDRPKCPNFTCSKNVRYQRSFQRILAFMGITENLEITLAGDLIVFSGGVGASAAAAVAIARAVNNYFSLGWDNEQINEAALQGEKEIHGNPSGVDNTAATYGGVFLFEKKRGIVKTFSSSNVVELVLIDSGKPSDTSAVIADVAQFRQKHPDKVEHLFESYTHLVRQAEHALESENWKRVGALMNKNYDLLKHLGVSNQELDAMVVKACDVGAYGAKLTGTGRGGLVVALTPGMKLQERVAQALQDDGYMSIKVRLFL